jgi:hypothetical protein
MVVCKRYLFDCEVYTSRGNAATSMSLVSKETLAIYLAFVTFEVVGMGKVDIVCTGAIVLQSGKYVTWACKKKQLNTLWLKREVFWRVLKIAESDY